MTTPIGADMQAGAGAGRRPVRWPSLVSPWRRTGWCGPTDWRPPSEADAPELDRAVFDTGAIGPAPGISPPGDECCSSATPSSPGSTSWMRDGLGRSRPRRLHRRRGGHRQDGARRARSPRGADDAVRVAVGRCDALGDAAGPGTVPRRAAALGIDAAGRPRRPARAACSASSRRRRRRCSWSRTPTGPTTPRSSCWPCSAGAPPTCRCCSSSPIARTRSPPSTRCASCSATSPRAAGRRGSGCARSRPTRCDGLAESAGAPGDELYELTGGNPFYVTEALAATGHAVPTTVRLAVLARARGCLPPARAVLDAVAIVPGRAERWLVEALYPPEPAHSTLVVAGGVLVADDGTYAFRHELARLAVEAELGERRRRDAAPAGGRRAGRRARASTRPASPTMPRPPATTPRWPVRGPQACPAGARSHRATGRPSATASRRSRLSTC